MTKGTRVVCIKKGNWINGIGDIYEGPVYGEECEVDGIHEPTRYLYIKGYDIRIAGIKCRYNNEKFVEITIPYVDLSELIQQAEPVVVEQMETV